MNRNFSLLFFLAVTALAAFSGSQFTPGEWYAGLAKPEWTPPSWVFSPVWIALYIMIAFAGWKVWKYQGLGLALLLWFLQLGLNAAWSYLMFGQRDITSALIDICALLVSILAFIIVARKISMTAALLFVPYFLWVAFAAALNAAIWQLNVGG